MADVKVHLLNQLIMQLHLPAQVWAPDGTVLVTNRLFNELLGFPSPFDWFKHGMSLLSDKQIIAGGVDTHFKRALHGQATELHSVKYEPSINPLASNSRTGVLKLSFILRPLCDEYGAISCIVCFASDYSGASAGDESHMMRIQKMENLEILASGVAHEFNNIFTGIKGLADLIRDEVDTASEIHEFATSIHQNIARGAELIQQLSSFAREMPHSLRAKKLSEYVEAALPLMRIQLQRRISIELMVKADGEVLIDPSRMDQALANIMHNARDAMGGQGKVLLTLDRVAPLPIPGLDFPPGIQWIMLEVADSGPGIKEELQERVVEPFFSTKERGKATGLGLSVTNRIIMSHNGVLQIANSPVLGGAAIRIFLPLYAGD